MTGGRLKTSHFPPLDKEWLPAQKSTDTQSAVKVSEGASDGNTASEGDVSKTV